MKYKKRRKIRYDRILMLLLLVIMIVGLIFTFNIKKESLMMLEFINKNVTELEKFVSKNDLILNKNYEYNDEIEKDNVISQSIEKGKKLKKNDNIDVVVSLGKIDKEVYKENKVNELGRIPVMMYHGVHNLKSSDTSYIGGNVDKDGYQRTTEAFINDLEFYYQSGYRMIKLNDYVNGTIDVPLGKSPIVITFDDGLKNNIIVKGLDNNGEIIIDENSAVGILESFKKKYPDYNVTATFFVNAGLFEQPKYNDKIIKWLVNNGYDVGNHTYSHGSLDSMTIDKVQEEVGSIYNKLNDIIPNKYINIVALPFGKPYNRDDSNYKYILNGIYNNTNYETVAALRVGWESDYSPFSKSFDKTYIKRIRAYDNNGIDFDIAMNFERLKNNRYISDGDKNTIVIPKEDSNYLIKGVSKEIIEY